jgi:serine/threonine protein kinase
MDEEDVRREIEEHLTNLMQPGYKIGSGQIADVYCGREDDEMEGFCIKHIARVTSKSSYENRLKREMELQTEAYRILERARAKGLSVGHIPRPWAYLKTSDNKEIMSMDRVPGKTLYRLMLEYAAKAMPDEHLLPGTRREDFPHLSDEDLAEMVLVRYLHSGTKTRAQLYAGLTAKAGTFLPTETAVQLRNTVKALNAERLFHRDLHEKNVMFSDDLKSVYVIDFGSASHKEHANLKDATEVESMGSQLRYQRDDGILTTVASISKKVAKKT